MIVVFPDHTRLLILIVTRTGYTMGCPHVCGDNPRALASGLSYIQVGKHGLTFCTTYISVDLVHHEIFVLKLLRVV